MLANPADVTASVRLGGFLCGDDEAREAGERLGEAEEWVAQQLRGATPSLDVHLQTLVDEVLQHWRQLVALLNLRLAVRRNQVQRLQ